jgi:hypothetical protein
MPYHELYKIVEVETGKEGKFTISCPLNPFVDSPEIVVYKEGYVAWRNDYIFQTLEKRKYITVSSRTIKLERFKDYYSKEKHHSFMSQGLIGVTLEKTPKYFEAEGKELEEALRIKRKSY